MQVLKSKNRVPTARGYRTKAFFAFATGALSTTVTLPTGSYAVGYRFVETATGRETALVPLTVLTVALSVEDGGLLETRNPTPAPPQGEGMKAPARAKKAA